MGTLLLEFLEFYGTRFDHNTTGIRFSESGSLVPKAFFENSRDSTQCLPALCIEDPLSPGNNVARRSYSSTVVLQAFKNAYYTLSGNLDEYSTEGSALSSILHISSVSISL